MLDSGTRTTAQAAAATPSSYRVKRTTFSRRFLRDKLDNIDLIALGMAAWTD
jgi:hypothetical protein